VGDVPAGDVEPGEAGEEGHDERDPSRGDAGAGGGRGREGGRGLEAAVLASHGAGQRLHGGGGGGDLRRWALSAPAPSACCR
jgi:hypothetical protein